MKKFFAALIVCLVALTCSICSAAGTGMKLYRNTEYQFSIEIPDYLSYRTPRGPNVKMSAATRNFNMNIIIRPSPEVETSDDMVLAEIYSIQSEDFRRNDVKIIEADIINIPNTGILYFSYLARYNFPTETFF